MNVHTTMTRKVLLAVLLSILDGCSCTPAAPSPLVTLVITPSGPVWAGDDITVRWGAINGFTPLPGDFVGAFAPNHDGDGGAAPNVRTVTARQCLSAACRDSRPIPPSAAGKTSSSQTNDGSIEFRSIVHSRTNYTFLYFSPQRCAGCWDRSALAFSPTLTFADPNEPAGVHLSLTGVAGEAVVSFSTRTPNQPEVPAVWYGPVPTGAGAGAGAASAVFDGGHLSTNVATGTATTFTAYDLCGAPANNVSSGDFVPVRALLTKWLFQDWLQGCGMHTRWAF